MHRRSVVVPALLVLALAASLEACSLVFTHGPPSNHEQLHEVNCTTSNAGPILDMVAASIVLANLAADYANLESYEVINTNFAVGSILGGVMYGVFSVIGFDKTAKCRAAKGQLAGREERARVAGLPTLQAANAGSLDSVRVTPAGDTIYVGQSVQLVAHAFTSGKEQFVGFNFRWSSSNNAIARVVKQSGLVHALAPGTVIIGASAGNVVGTAAVVVTWPP